MQLTVKGKQIDVGDALRTHVADSLNSVVGKYFNNSLEANVVFSRDAHLFKADIQVHVGRGILLQSASEATEPYPAFDTACEKLGKRLRRYKRRLRDHHRDRTAPVEFDGGSSYILAPTEEPEDTETAELQPIVIAEMETKIPSITVGEAVMQLELGGQKMLVFRNEGHGGVNVVYRRDDGNIGWIDPRNSK